MAHAWLSGSNEGVMVGNFIADHLRGNDFSRFPAEVVQGIKMHRAIDLFTDAHTNFRAVKRHFYGSFNRHSGILTDIYFDYLLARDFNHYTGLELVDFSSQAYAVYTRHFELIPETAQRFYHYLIRNNIYPAYATKEGITTVLLHLAKRIGHGVSLEKSMIDFIRAEPLIVEDFQLFLSDLKREFIP